MKQEDEREGVQRDHGWMKSPRKRGSSPYVLNAPQSLILPVLATGRKRNSLYAKPNAMGVPRRITDVPCTSMENYTTKCDQQQKNVVL
jgi:hypothetical protein